jgi:hypothetical protein
MQVERERERSSQQCNQSLQAQGHLAPLEAYQWPEKIKRKKVQFLKLEKYICRIANNGVVLILLSRVLLCKF